MITVNLISDPARRRLDGLAAQIKRPAGLAAVLGREAVNRLIDHFRHRDANEPNKLGGTRQHFWRQVSDSLSAPRVSVDGTTVSVVVNHAAFAQKLKGGPIEPKRKKSLAIPVAPDAYGRTAGGSGSGSAGSFEAFTGLKLFVLKGPNLPGGPFLAAMKGGTLRVYYVLRSRVVQAPDPKALPASAALEAALLDRAERYVRRIAQSEDGGIPAT